MQIKRIRWGMIGCGEVTEVKSGPAFQKAERSELVAVMRRNAEKAADYARRHDIPRWYDDAEALIRDPAVDAVYIATPPVFHKQYVLQIARAGKPIYVEKPMAMNYAECLEMIAACADAGVPLFVAYYRRALPRFLKIRELLSENAIGTVRAVNTVFYRPPLDIDLTGGPHWRVDPQIGGAGYFYDLACHNIDILQFLLGDIVAASGFASNQQKLYPAADAFSGAYLFESGVQGTCIWNFSSYNHIDRTEIIGTKGRIAFSTFGEEAIGLENSGGRREFSIANPMHIQQPLIQTIVDELTGRGRCFSTGQTGAPTNWVMDRILNQP